MKEHTRPGAAATDDAPRDERLARVARLLQDQGPDGPQVAPLSSAQHRLWFLDELHPGDTAYVEVIAVRLTGPLDVDALRAALGTLVARHAALRTRFPVGETGAVQLVRPHLDWHLDVVDGAANELEDSGVLAARLAGSGLLAPFNLAQLPLFRAQLRIASPTEAVLVVVIHHIVWDGGSAQILLDDLVAGYDAARGRVPDPPPPATDYLSCTRAEKRELDSAEIQRSVNYWRQRLAAASPTVWPDPQPRPAATRRTGVVQRHVRAELAGDLRERAEELGCTPFMVSAACVATTLRRYTSEDEVVIGVPVSVRPAQADRVLGCFVNTLPLRIALPRTTSHRAFLELLRDRCLEMMTHQRVPFDRIIEAVAPARRLTNPPYLQVLVEYNRLPAPAGTSDGVRWELDWLPGRRAKCDLLISWNESSRGLMVRVEYDTSYVSEPVAEEVAEGMRDMLSALTLDLDAPLGTLPRFPAPADPVRPLSSPASPLAAGPGGPSGSPAEQPGPLGPVRDQADPPPLGEVLVDLTRDLWREVLEVPQVGDDDDFFELGGHSLLATRLVKKLSTAFNRTIPVQLVFTTESFKEFTQRLELECRDGA